MIKMGDVNIKNKHMKRKKQHNWLMSYEIKGSR